LPRHQNASGRGGVPRKIEDLVLPELGELL
jgi:hypothetical protein